MSWWKRSPCSSPTLPVSRKLVDTLILMLAPRRWYASSMFCTTSSKLAAVLLPRKFCTTPTKPHHASASYRFIENMKFSSCISFRISGPSKIPALSFSIVCLGNDRQMYLKHSPYLSRAFTNCLISPNFICRGGSIILSLGIRGSFIMFLSHALSVIRGSQSFSTQWLALSRLSHIQKKHGCFVYTDRRRFSSYAGCILSTQEPVLLIHNPSSAPSNDLLELKLIHLCCITTHISNFSWNCQWIGATSSPPNEQYLIPLVKALHYCKQQFLHIAWNTEESYLFCSCRMWHLSWLAGNFCP